MRRASVARVFVLCSVAGLGLGAPCPGGQPLTTVKLDQPRAAQLFDDPSPLVRGAGRVGTNFALGSIEVRLDGVDLVSALGLTPPFQSQGGAVVLPSGSVTISGFAVHTPGGQHSVSFDVAGLAESPHTLEISALRIVNPAVVAASTSFALISPLGIAAQGFPAAARAVPAAAPGGVLAHQTAGEAGAAAPVAIPGGSQLRSGFVPVAAALVTSP
jgi:hypothetical protein